MRIRRIAVLVLASGTAALAPLAQAADTTVSVTLAGDLTLAAPTSVSLGTVSAAAGSTISKELGSVTVADGRGSLLGWSVTAATTTATMSTGGATPKTIALGATGPLGWVTGTVAASGPSLITGVAAGAGGFLSTTAIPVATAVATSGGGSYTYNPTLTFTTPANAQAGTYSVVVTQTVS
ncbi:MAG: hypothetical protein M3394_06390 [Actinomycetota bacterium]|nr:hypothetical protein [Actinomycetota bacterium]